MRVEDVLRGASCLLFDYGGTLDADGVAWKEQFAALYRAEGLDAPDAAFDRAFYDADDPLIGTLPTDADLDETARRLVGGLEAALGGDAARGRRVASRFVQNTRATVARNQPVLEALARRYRLGVVSNFYGNLDAVLRELGLRGLFGAVADSEIVGATKPDPALFAAAMAPLAARAETTVMIGDSIRRDGAGAAAAGVRFVWLAPADASGHAHPRIASLHELTGVLA